jgi:hypothetical protein
MCMHVLLSCTKALSPQANRKQAMPVGAQVTYDYTGQAMTLTGVAGSASAGSQTYTMSYSFLGDVVLAQALNPNSVGGTWAQAPEINASAAITALSLLFGVALVLDGRRRSQQALHVGVPRARPTKCDLAGIL